MKVFIVIAVAMLTVLGLSYLASAHGYHSAIEFEEYVSSISKRDASSDKSETIKINAKDAFYGNTRTQAERDEIDGAHQARLRSKSGDGFMSDFLLAFNSIMNRLIGK